jgi:hypothetical protein
MKFGPGEPPHRLVHGHGLAGEQCVWSKASSAHRDQPELRVICSHARAVEAQSRESSGAGIAKSLVKSRERQSRYWPTQTDADLREGATWAPRPERRSWPVITSVIAPTARHPPMQTASVGFGNARGPASTFLCACSAVRDSQVDGEYH